MDELFNYTLEYKPLVIVNEYHFGLSLYDFDKCILNHGVAKECEVCQKREYLGGDVIEGEWEVRIHFVSTEEDIPYLLQISNISCSDLTITSLLMLKGVPSITDIS